MTKEEVVAHWVESSDSDSAVMESLFSNDHYSWSLFVGHLVVEKMLKAHYAANKDANVPRTHNLTRIAAMSELPLSEAQEDFLDEVTTFNIDARYTDEKDRFHKKATKEFTGKYIKEIKEFCEWLKESI